jgi:hypothetical protein
MWTSRSPVDGQTIRLCLWYRVDTAAGPPLRARRKGSEHDDGPDTG